MTEFFQGVEPIRSEGPESTNPLVGSCPEPG